MLRNRSALAKTRAQGEDTRTIQESLGLAGIARDTAHCNQTRGNQYTNEFYQAHSLARGQTTMSLEFSSIVNWR